MIIPGTMAAVALTGHGGFEKLRYLEDAPTPQPCAGEVLIEIGAAGINNTDINTRIGWYGSAQAGSTADALIGAAPVESGGWSGGIAFPRIQGADVCGHIVAVGDGVAASRIGERVIVQSCLISLKKGDVTPWLGSERDGGFARYACAPSADTHAVQSLLSDVELAALPCGFGTAQNLLMRAGVKAGETVLVTGASGNVGLAAVQLAKLRGARVVAIASLEKHQGIAQAGAGVTLERDAALVDALGESSVDVVIDLVGGPQWPQLLDVLRPGGRYAVSGAIGGPMVSLDLRKLYLKDLSFFGCTAQTREGFLALVALAQTGTLRPLIARTFKLSQIVQAQEAFLSKRHLGKIVLIPE